MTYLVAYKRAKKWQQKIRIIAVYHTVRSLKKKSWRVRDTAKYFHISMGNASENLQLADDWARFRECRSRNAALKKLRGLV